MSIIIEIVIQGRIIVQGNETRAELARIGIDIEALTPGVERQEFPVIQAAIEEAKTLREIIAEEDRMAEQQIADPAQETPAPADSTTQEWPIFDDVGNLIDSTGARWDPAIHSAGKTVTASGVWRRKKGVATAQGDSEQAPVPDENGADPAPGPSDDDEQVDIQTVLRTESGGTATFDGVLKGIAAAKTAEEVAEWRAVGASLNLYPAGLALIEEEADKRLIEINVAPDAQGDTFDSIRAAIEASIFPNEITDWLDRARNVVLKQGERYALEAVAEERHRQLAARSVA